MSVESTISRSGRTDSELLQELNDRIASIVEQSKQDHVKTCQLLESVLERIDQIQVRLGSFDSAPAMQTGQHPEDNVENPQNRAQVDLMNDPLPILDSIVDPANLEIHLEKADPAGIEDQAEQGLSTEQHQAEANLTQDVISELAKLFAETNCDEPVVDDADGVDLWEHVKRKLFSDFHFAFENDDQLETRTLTNIDNAAEVAADRVARTAKSNELNDALGITAELPDEIDSIRRELEEKLRMAEIELSIQRARISNQQAKLEERQLWLDQREREIQQTAGDKGELNRWSRHLPMPRKKAE